MLVVFSDASRAPVPESLRASYEQAAVNSRRAASVGAIVRLAWLLIGKQFDF